MPDVNVWLALASKRHVHHIAAAAWIESIGSEQVAFCRISQMGLLRLLTNRHVMGADILESKQAWAVYHRMAKDPRVAFLPEPVGLEGTWERFVEEWRPATQIWTDAYLRALAHLHGAILVSFDRAIGRFDAPVSLILRAQ